MSRGMVDTGTIQHLAMATSCSKPNLAGCRQRQRQDRQHPQPMSRCSPQPTSPTWEAAAGVGRENEHFPALLATLVSPGLSYSPCQAAWRARGYLSVCGFPSALPELSPGIPVTAGGTGLGFPTAVRQGTGKQNSVWHQPLLERCPFPGHCTHMKTGQRGSCKGNPPGVHGTVVRGRGQIGEGYHQDKLLVCTWC